MASEYRTVIEGDKEPVPSEERERQIALQRSKEVVDSGGASSAGLESDPESQTYNRSTSSLSRSSSGGRSKKEMLDLKRQAVGALPRGASRDDNELNDVIQQAGIAQDGEVRESIVGDPDPIPQQEAERQEAVESAQEKKGVGRKIKDKLAGLFGSKSGKKQEGSGMEQDASETEPATGAHKRSIEETPQAADLASGWTGADALTQDASKRTKPHEMTSANGPLLESDTHWGPGIGAGGAEVDQLEAVMDDGVIRIRGGGYDSDEEADLYPPEMMRLRGGGFDLGKEEAAAEKVLEAGAKQSGGHSVFQAKKDDDDTDYDHGLKGVGTGKEPAEAHGVNTQETGKVKAPGIGERIKEEVQAFTGLFSSKK